MDKKFNFQELQAIVATLRGENGCPWDKSQTHESLKLYTLEEAYEVNQAVSNLTKTGDCTDLKEESSLPGKPPIHGWREKSSAETAGMPL